MCRVLNYGLLAYAVSFQEKNKSVMRGSNDDPTLNVKMSEGSTRLPEGVIHIYRHTQNTVATFVGGGDDQDASAVPSRAVVDSKDTVKIEQLNDGTTLAVLAVPSYMSPVDFMTFIAPASDSVAHLRMIRYF